MLQHQGGLGHYLGAEYPEKFAEAVNDLLRPGKRSAGDGEGEAGIAVVEALVEHPGAVEEIAVQVVLTGEHLL